MKTAYGYIRLSSAKQLKGTGEERQSNSTKLDDICKAHGWIASGQTFKDLGVSAWKGKNRLQGNLSIFIQLLKANKLAAEPVLAVEAFDRISRQDIDESEPAILDLLKLGCDIHVAFNNKTFTKESTKSLVDRIEILVSLKAAYDYSQNLSKRVLAQQTIKRGRMASGEVLKHHNAPKYYSYNKDKKAYEQNDVTWIVERIIKEFLSGTSLYRISTDLNNDKIRSLRYANKQSQWSRMAIKSLLESKCLYGEFLGIPDYFGQPIITKPKYDKIQGQLKRNSENKGRYATEHVNIFRNMARCKTCNRPMTTGKQLIDYRTQKPKPTPYFSLKCSSLSNGFVCENTKLMNLTAIEESLFTEFLLKNPEDLVTGDDKTAVQTIDADITKKQTRLNELNTEAENLAVVVNAMPTEKIFKLVQSLKKEKDALLVEIDSLNASKSNILSAPESRDIIGSIIEFGDDKETVTPLKSQFSMSKIQSNLKDNAFRMQLRLALPTLISKILFDAKIGQYFVFNRAGKQVFASEPLEYKKKWKQAVSLAWLPEHRKAMKGMTPKQIKEYTENVLMKLPKPTSRQLRQAYLIAYRAGAKQETSKAK